MDKNQFTGLILMFGLLAVYFMFFSPSPPVKDSVQEEVVSDSSIKQSSVITIAEERLDSIESQAIDTLKYGAFLPGIGKQEKTEVLENQELIVKFSNLGGRIMAVTLKNHKDYKGDPFTIFAEGKSDYSLQIPYKGEALNLSDMAFSSTLTNKGDTVKVNFRFNGQGFSIAQSYSLPPQGFQIDYQLSSTGLNSIMDTKDVGFQWNQKINRAERNLEDARYNSNIRYATDKGEYDDLSQRSDEFKEASIDGLAKWISFKQKFFTSAFIADKGLKSAYVSTVADVGDTSTVKNGVIQAFIPYVAFLNGFDGRFYFGPNNYTVLKKVTDGFEKNLDMGWGPLPIVNRYLIIPIFHFLEKFINNYGVVILIIVFIVKIILSPLTHKSHISMAKMRVMKPELDEIKARHEGDMQKTQQEQMQLYRKVGINPLSGCIPMLLQVPVLFSLFFFFPNAVELRQKSFLWAEDLSTYDSILHLPFTIPWYGDHVSLFTLLMTVSTILITATNSQTTAVQGPMKTMQYVMPIMFLFVLNSYAAGLTYYYFVSNMFTYGQTLIFRKLVDEEKIKATLEENRKNNANKKKSKFQSRLEDAMKTRQEAQRLSRKKK